MYWIDGPGATADHKFTEGDPASGIAATTVTDDFMNDVQQELLQLLTNAGITPAKNTQNQVAAAIRQLSGNYSGYSNYSGSVTIPASDQGKWSICNFAGAGGVVTLPDPTTLPVGATFTIEVIGFNATVTCVGAGAASFSGPAMQANASSYRLLNANFAVFVNLGSQWRVWGGGGKAAPTANGYLQFANNLILQWGSASVAANNAQTNVTLPVAFPNGMLQGATSWVATCPTNGSTGISGVNTTTIALFNSYTTAQNVRYMVIGY